MVDRFLRAWSKNYWKSSLYYLVLIGVVIGIGVCLDRNIDLVKLLIILILFNILVLIRSIRRAIIFTLRKEYGDDWMFR